MQLPANSHVPGISSHVPGISSHVPDISSHVPEIITPDSGTFLGLLDRDVWCDCRIVLYFVTAG